MYKSSGNPKIEELTKSCKERRMNLSDLSAIVLDGKKYCAWCGITELTGRKYKWCGPECSDNAFAWANPQKEYALNILLARQDWKCNLCPATWKGMALEIYQELYGKRKNFSFQNFGTSFDPRLIKRLKYRCSLKFRIEVDHIIPIHKGGQALGIDNHQAICYVCHKAKTGKDLSGKRKKDAKENKVGKKI